MPNVTTAAAYQQILSMAVEDRSSGYEDLVSNNNALLAVLRRKGLWQTYSGPRIRQTLQVGKQVAQWYSEFKRRKCSLRTLCRAIGIEDRENR